VTGGEWNILASGLSKRCKFIGPKPKYDIEITENLLQSSNELGLETNSGKNKYVLMARHTTGRQITLHITSKFSVP
jgi:hypothetical protein